MRTILVSSLIIAAVLLGSCEGDSILNPDNRNSPVRLRYSSADSAEAFELALWFEGNYLPADSTVRKLLFNINYLRYVLGDSYPVLKENRFTAPWIHGMLLLRFDDSTATLVKDGSYDGWNLLDEFIRPDTVINSSGSPGHVEVRFDEPFNPLRLAIDYEKLPGVMYSSPNRLFSTNDIYRIIPGVVNGEMSYVFIESDDIGSPRWYYYFRYVDGEPVFVGVRPSESGHTAWWPEAQKNMDLFEKWLGP